MNNEAGMGKCGNEYDCREKKSDLRPIANSAR
jgi:hypothetical protein